MAKPALTYHCNACSNTTSKWAGKCEACGGWNTIDQKETAGSAPKGLSKGKGRRLELVALDGKQAETPRQAIGIHELDRVLGGGIVSGSAVLIGGDPGIGKSTLLLQVAAKIASNNLRCFYFSGEESTGQIQLRAKRLGLEQSKVTLATATSVRDIIHTLEKDTPDLVIIDSIQTMYVDNIDAAPGTVTQVRSCSNELIRFAKQHNCAVFLVGHVTKDGQIAGPRVLEHMVDTVLYFEGERGHEFRILRAVKNRFGGTDEIGVFEMRDTGLSEVANPSALFLNERDQPVSGTAIFAGMEGSRPLLVEIQALLAPTPMANPRRAVVGWDSGRLAMLLAVLETRCGIALHDKEVYLSVAGGLRVSEPAADLAVAAALLSALTDIPTPEGAIYFGEVGLSGEIRKVSRAPARTKEAEKLGFKKAYMPKSEQKSGLQCTSISHLADLNPLFSIT
ncbi:MAG: DNA repair protein RadA [Rickettsiales bacterium]|nr:DNA repair protein RadA [Rickettsiales bacterium]